MFLRFYSEKRVVCAPVISRNAFLGQGQAVFHAGPRGSAAGCLTIMAGLASLTGKPALASGRAGFLLAEPLEGGLGFLRQAGVTISRRESREQLAGLGSGS